MIGASGARPKAFAALLAGAGLCVAAYLTLVHYAQGQVPLVCAGVASVLQAELAWTAAGLLVVFYLVCAELFLIGRFASGARSCTC